MKHVTVFSKWVRIADAKPEDGQDVIVFQPDDKTFIAGHYVASESLWQPIEGGAWKITSGDLWLSQASLADVLSASPAHHPHRFARNTRVCEVCGCSAYAARLDNRSCLPPQARP